MNTTSETIKPQHPFVAGFWLIAAIPMTVMILLPVAGILGLGDDVTERPVLVAMFTVHCVTGYLWARSLSRRAGLPDNKWMNISGGIGFALGVVGILATIPEFAQTPIDRWLAKFDGVGNLEFGALFAPWTGIAAGLAGLGLGLGLRDGKLALKLLALGFLTGFGLYLAIMFTMELLGFKVGSGRPVMLPTTFLSMWSAALVGSAIFGRMLAKSRIDEMRSDP
jgi:hypothetical protein